MARSRLDLRTLMILLAATGIGAAWAIYNRGLTTPPYDETELRPLVWVIFATPAAFFIGWFIARKSERWWAAFVCFCLYFFSPFIAQRYESCTIVSGAFNPVDCIAATEQAQQLSNSSGHTIYFQAVVIVHIIAAILIALHRAFHPAGQAPAEAPGSAVAASQEPA